MTQGLQYHYEIHNMENKQEILMEKSYYGLLDINKAQWDNTHEWKTRTEGYNLFKRKRPDKKQELVL